MSANENKERLERAIAELANGNSAPFIACMADDLVWTIQGATPWSRSLVGKAAVLDELLRPLQARIDGPYRMTAHRFLADGDLVVVEGRGDNRLRDGQRYDNTYCWICRLEDGRLREVTEYMDTDLVMRVFGPRADAPARPEPRRGA